MKYTLQKIHIAQLSRLHFSRTVVWAMGLSAAIVVASAALARAAHNFKIAFTDKPDIAIYLLLPDEQISKTTILRQSDTERDYLAETKDGPKLVKLKRGQNQWYAALIEPLHENDASVKENSKF